MKMPIDDLDARLFAPCGMNCLVCYKYCNHKKPCVGCRMGEEGKPEHCRRCAIKDCARENGCFSCYECSVYPCKRIKALEKSYRLRYGASLVENGRLVQQEGTAAFFQRQKARFTCPECGGVISLHDKVCSECGRALQR